MTTHDTPEATEEGPNDWQAEWALGPDATRPTTHDTPEADYDRAAVDADMAYLVKDRNALLAEVARLRTALRWAFGFVGLDFENASVADLRACREARDLLVLAPSEPRPEAGHIVRDPSRRWEP